MRRTHPARTPRPVITVTSDFGDTDSYSAQLSGVLLSECPDVDVLQLSHNIPAHDLAHAARFLAEAVPRFPAGVVHLAVVDPGVGGTRRPVIIKCKTGETKEFFLVGPDNGIFHKITSSCTIQAWEIHTGRSNLTTFDGRDLFAPAAAKLAAGAKPEELGTLIDLAAAPLTTLPDDEPERLEGGIICGKIVYFDRFGNAISNIRGKFEEIKDVRLRDDLPVLKLVRTYEEIEAGTIAALINSQGVLELAAPGASARASFGLVIGDTVRVEGKGTV